jgi:sugar phosphate isomerase/epimerase
MKRREFVYQVGAAAGSAMLPLGRLVSAAGFNIGILTDEISQDFGHACEVAAKEFGVGFVELRAMHGKNVMLWGKDEIAEARQVLARFNLRVSEIASPVFKTDWPGAPKSPFSPKNPQFGATDWTFEQQDELLDRSIDLAKAFNTTYVRIFDFWRLENQAPHRTAIDDRVRQGAVRAAAKGITLNLENELACNTALGSESARLLAAVPDKGLMLNWDPGNAAARGESPFPEGYAKLPKARIKHVHCKDVARKAGTEADTTWAPMGKGMVDWLGQFRALRKDGYTGVLSLETHWRLPGDKGEESSRQSMAGMKSLLKQAET